MIHLAMNLDRHIAKVTVANFASQRGKSKGRIASSDIVSKVTAPSTSFFKRSFQEILRVMKSIELYCACLATTRPKLVSRSAL